MAFTAAVIGARGFGAVHVREWLAHGAGQVAVLNASAQSSVACAADLASRYSAPVVAASDLDALVRLAPAAVSICAPNRHHLDALPALIGAGAHVVIEKPMYWDVDLTPAEIVGRCREAFRIGGDRLAVHHPTVHLAQSYRDIAGDIGALQTLDFVYVSRGPYRFAEIGVDMLPHGLSALFTLDPAMLTQSISDVAVVSEERHWSVRFRCGTAAVSFRFSQLDGVPSAVEFTANGRSVRRVQVQVGQSTEVALSMDGGDPVKVANPVATAIGGYAADIKAGSGFTKSSELALTIMERMATLLAIPA